MQPEPPKQKLTPLLRWAQKNPKIFITIPLRDLTNETSTITPTSISFSGSSNSKLYQYTLQLYAPIDPSLSKTSKTGAYFLYELAKKDGKIKWPRLNKENRRLANVLIDWDRWDQQSEEEGQEEEMRELSGGKIGRAGEWNDDYEEEDRRLEEKQFQDLDNDHDFKQEKMGNGDFDDDHDDKDVHYRDQGGSGGNLEEGYDDKYERDQGNGRDGDWHDDKGDNDD